MPGQMCARHKSHVAVALTREAAHTWSCYNVTGNIYHEMETFQWYGPPTATVCPIFFTGCSPDVHRSHKRGLDLTLNDAGCCLIQSQSILWLSNSLAYKANG